MRARVEEDLASRFRAITEALWVTEADAIREAIRQWCHNAGRRKPPLTERMRRMRVSRGLTSRPRRAA